MSLCQSWRLCKMKTEFVTLDELNFDEEFKNALGELEQRIFESYNEFMPVKKGGLPSTVEGEHPMFTEFKQGLGYSPKGTKYLKVVMDKLNGQTSVWGFIAKQDFETTNKLRVGNPIIKFKEGDILKSAGWNTPTLNAPRGNIFTDEYTVSWCGPNYLT